MFGDAEAEQIFSERRLVQSWLDVEISLAAAQAELGLIEPETATAIASAARFEHMDLGLLWTEAQTVGYPILPLVRQIENATPPEHRGRVHFGATTQDIMDSGLALQLTAATARLETLLQQLGDQIATLAQRYATTVIAARTHAQQAVPTTLGTKLAVYLAEITRHRSRLMSAGRDVSVLSLFGAGGTSAAYGGSAAALRKNVAARLGLRPVDVPWHVARDSLAAYASTCAAMAATTARFAREVIDLSRTEIAELAEADGYLRGASSTMPQKRNPIESEAVIGFAVCAEALSVAMLRAMEAGHERSAGEWQVEWQALPQLVSLTCSGLLVAGSIARGLRVFPERMRQNLRADAGLVMAEAYMMRLAPVMGRDRAHELVYDAARRTRENGEDFVQTLRQMCPEGMWVAVDELDPGSYIGVPEQTIAAALSAWAAGGVESATELR
ncbi:lyase family protein [Streptomyces sp. NPDC004752]